MLPVAHLCLLPIAHLYLLPVAHLFQEGLQAIEHSRARGAVCRVVHAAPQCNLNNALPCACIRMSNTSSFVRANTSFVGALFVCVCCVWGLPKTTYTNCTQLYTMSRVGQNHMYTPFTTVHLMKFLQSTPCIHRSTNIWFWPSLTVITYKERLRTC